MNTQKRSTLILAILIPLAVGFLSALLSGNRTAYPALIKPPLSPPGFVFPLVWMLLYILMGISSYLIYISEHADTERALLLYAVQLVFNFAWSIIFFGFSSYLFAFIWLVILIILIILMIISFYAIDPSAAYLQIPYLLWCLFAAYLNFGIFLLN